MSPHLRCWGPPGASSCRVTPCPSAPTQSQRVHLPHSQPRPSCASLAQLSKGSRASRASLRPNQSMQVVGLRAPWEQGREGKEARPSSSPEDAGRLSVGRAQVTEQAGLSLVGSAHPQARVPSSRKPSWLSPP